MVLLRYYYNIHTTVKNFCHHPLQFGDNCYVLVLYCLAPRARAAVRTACVCARAHAHADLHFAFGFKGVTRACCTHAPAAFCVTAHARARVRALLPCRPFRLRRHTFCRAHFVLRYACLACRCCLRAFAFAFCFLVYALLPARIAYARTHMGVRRVGHNY